jgi:hypothetical protein
VPPAILLVESLLEANDESPVHFSATWHAVQVGPVTPVEARGWAARIVDCLGSDRSGSGLHPHFALASLRLLVGEARRDGIPLQAYRNGIWRVVRLEPDSTEGNVPLVVPAVQSGRVAIALDNAEEAFDTAAVLNWCGVDESTLSH